MAHSTFNDRLIETAGRPAGFDYLRIVLATSVIFFHSFDLGSTGSAVWVTQMHGLFRPIDALVLPMFFALSGFLVAGSLERSRTLISFLGLRVIRLMPALLVETVLSAIVIGLLFTQLPYKEYFDNRMFFEYFLNIVGDIHYYLPGVFQQAQVNGQLWTIPWELKCYFSISVISLAGIASRKAAFMVLVVLLNVAIFIYHGFMGAHHLDHAMAGGSFSGVLLVQSFLYGVGFYLLRSAIGWSKWFFVTAILASYLLTSLPIAFWGDSLTPLLIAYATIYLGLLQPYRSRIVSSGDYSYGVYLYGFPVQKAVVTTLGAAGTRWYVNFPISLAIASLLAIASWHLFEKHAASFRPLLFKTEKVVLNQYFTLKARWVPVRTDRGVNNTNIVVPNKSE